MQLQIHKGAVTSGHSLCPCESFSNDWDMKDCVSPHIQTCIKDRRALTVCVGSFEGEDPCMLEGETPAG